MYTRLTKEGRALRDGAFKVLGWMALSGGIIVSIVFVCGGGTGNFETRGQSRRSVPPSPPPAAQAAAPVRASSPAGLSTEAPQSPERTRTARARPGMIQDPNFLLKWHWTATEKPGRSVVQSRPRHESPERRQEASNEKQQVSNRKPRVESEEKKNEVDRGKRYERKRDSKKPEKPRERESSSRRSRQRKSEQ